MTFVHIADIHFDCPFTSLSSLGNIRRLEQRKIFKKVIQFIKENDIDCFFISGDLYEHEYTQSSTIEYINNLFKEIPNTKIFISPGNHDPYIKDSYYATFEFAENVHIFKGSIEKVELEDVNIYGMAFNSFYMSNSEISNFILPVSSKPNVFVVHCDLNSSKGKDGFEYNPINESKLKALNFDYVAMGHIHKSNYEKGKENKILYSGSPISQGFDELGEHGMIVGEIANGRTLTEFIKLDDREFIEFELNVEAFNSKEDLIEHITSLNLNENNVYKIILCGKRNFDIDTREILKLISVPNVLKIKDTTKINYDLEEISKENNLRGIFVREVLKMQASGEFTEEEIQKAIEIGLEAM
jgi:DNA repair exonuclease SbcCD nuclease subunit